jgi:hypothetical protein
MTSTYRLDDATVGAFQRRLEVIEADIDREETAELPFADGRIVPLDIQNTPWAASTTYRRLSRVGFFKLVRSYFTDIPIINLLSEEFTQKVYKWAAAYYFSDDDIEASSRQDFNLESEDIAGVVESSRQKLNDLIAFGDKALGMAGFVNHPDAMHSYSPFKLNASSTPRQCLAVLTDAVTAIVEATQQVEKPNTLLLPLRQYNYLVSTPWSDQMGSSILKQFLENSPHIKDIEPLNELAGAGQDGLDIMMVYRRDKQKVKAKIMQPLTWLQMQRKGLGYERPAVLKYAGVVLRRPMSIHVVAGI